MRTDAGTRTAPRCAATAPPAGVGRGARAATSPPCHARVPKRRQQPERTVTGCDRNLRRGRYAEYAGTPLSSNRVGIVPPCPDDVGTGATPLVHAEIRCVFPGPTPGQGGAPPSGQPLMLRRAPSGSVPRQTSDSPLRRAIAITQRASGRRPSPQIHPLAQAAPNPSAHLAPYSGAPAEDRPHCGSGAHPRPRWHLRTAHRRPSGARTDQGCGARTAPLDRTGAPPCAHPLSSGAHRTAPAHRAPQNPWTKQSNRPRTRGVPTPWASPGG